ncbi:MAG: hypothetical protein IPL09_01000 [Bacteroidetes bacterium]|nr:hypothetical protein [Bacteroidota bacterium]
MKKKKKFFSSSGPSFRGKKKKTERNKLEETHTKRRKGTFEFIGFKQTVKVCKQRLEIYGASFKKSKI